MTDLLAEFRNLAERIVPELNGLPFYVLWQPDTMPTPRDTFAYVLRGRSVMLRAHLIATGQWRNVYAPTIIFVDQPADREELLGSGIHELAHVLPAAWLVDREPSPSIVVAEIAALQNFATADALAEMEPEPWRDHDWRFVRRVLHLHYRALWEGVPIPFVHLHAAGNLYGLSPIWRYISAIGAEPFELSGASFAEIEETQPPAAFTELFAADVARYHANREVSKK